MLANGGGAIVHMASTAGVVGEARHRRVLREQGRAS